MKRQCVVWMVVFILILQFYGSAQPVAQVIDPMPVTISDQKTTHIIFPYAIKSIDRGSTAVLVQKASGVENVLQVKAATTEFKETNLTVMTADGRFYSFLLNYQAQLSLINIRLSASYATDHPAVLFDPDQTNDQIRQNAHRIWNKRGFIKHCNAHAYRMQASLKGIYADGGVLYFQVGLTNNSWMDYPIGQLRLLIRDLKTAKRTTAQEIEIKPTYILGNQNCIYNRSEQILVVVVPSFTVPDQKQFILQIQEAGGGRHLQLAIKNRQLTKAWKVF